MKKLILLFIACCLVVNYAYAKEITILYTGETHAMLYPCSCPKEPDGGIARRAALIKQLRKNNPDALLLDSGGFFAGGLMDEYTQNVQLDNQRTLVNLRAMELMQYDAVAVGDDEFNFGREFLEENIRKAKNLPFLSCNISGAGQTAGLFRPYLIKEAAGTKIGIIGVTGLFAKQKAGELEFIEPKIAVRQAVEELKKQNINIIVLLSHLGEEEDLKLLKDVEGIDILITGHSRQKEEPLTKIDKALLVRPSWQGRRLGKLSLMVKDGGAIDYKVEELRLSQEIKDDPQTLSILPACFSDNNCKKEGFKGACQNPGTPGASCEFKQMAKIPLLIIEPAACRTCNTEGVVNFLKSQFPGLVASHLSYPGPKADKLIQDLGIKGLPAYLLGKEIEQEKGFDNLRQNLETRGNFHLVKPQFSGISYFLNRKKAEGKLDLFISLYDKNAAALLDTLKDFNPTVHFLASRQNDNFNAANGSQEIEEDLRSVCVEKYYPQAFWNYISCRAKNIQSSWWQNCLVDLDVEKIRVCAQGEEGAGILKENIRLNQELEIMFGPAYLLDNQEIFASRVAPKKEDFQKIIHKK